MYIFHLLSQASSTKYHTCKQLQDYVVLFRITFLTTSVCTALRKLLRICTVVTFWMMKNLLSRWEFSWTNFFSRVSEFLLFSHASKSTTHSEAFIFTWVSIDRIEIPLVHLNYHSLFLQFILLLFICSEKSLLNWIEYLIQAC